MDRLGAVVMQLDLWVAQQHTALLDDWLARLEALHIHPTVRWADHIDARHLRQYSQLSLILDQHGLSLASDGMKMQPDWTGQVARLKRATHKNELIARACQTEQQPNLIDATAGLGHDALLLAWLGAKVTLIERHPVLFALLQDAFVTASQHPVLTSVMQRINLIHTDGADYLQNCIQQNAQTDIVYLDPMFPKSAHKAVKKQAQVKKEMQILHRLLFIKHEEVTEDDLGEYLLPVAQRVAPRVIVKRPRHALPLTQQKPQHQWLGDACRFDGYFQMI